MLHGMARVTVTVADEVLATWRRAAAVQRVSLSALIADALVSLEPGMREVAELGAALDRASDSIREGMRRGVIDASAEAAPVIQALWESWQATVRQTIERGAEAATPDRCNTGVR